jgi:small basic protein
VLSIVLFVLMMAIGLMVGLVAAVRLPQWITTTALVITVIAAVALALDRYLRNTVPRRLFPAIVMIEGQSAGNALAAL